MQVAEIFVLFCCVFYVFAETPIQKCPEGKELNDYKLTVKVGNCKRTPCKLKKGRLIVAEFKFTADRPIKSLSNYVNAQIGGLPFPFIGVDGTTACDHLYESDGKTKASCPLAAGQEYVYKNPINILEIYPVVKVNVHWALRGDDGKDAMCFEVPASIVN
ncbi:hypothetical protein RN001_000780 [Aquatica leii]|uniref:MD-2-related lipid-recognition domain-containing protein n=1 Tax=Aquatica leii TaxID=1421715 RepID=A0AAN7Q3C0_9COLE|nr:hypothetical protein RN001_000780 [Aquatica leii]